MPIRQMKKVYFLKNNPHTERAVDNIFFSMATVQKYITKRKGRFYCLFIDFSSAFDTVQHKLVWYILTKIGVHGKI